MYLPVFTSCKITYHYLPSFTHSLPSLTNQTTISHYFNSQSRADPFASPLASLDFQLPAGTVVQPPAYPWNLCWTHHLIPRKSEIKVKVGCNSYRFAASFFNINFFDIVWRCCSYTNKSTYMLCGSSWKADSSPWHEVGGSKDAPILCAIKTQHCPNPACWSESEFLGSITYRRWEMMRAINVHLHIIYIYI